MKGLIGKSELQAKSIPTYISQVGQDINYLNGIKFMEGTEAFSTTKDSVRFSVNSYDTALCIIPPRSCWPTYDRLRMRHDRAYGKWPPHINLLYPFVAPDALACAANCIAASVVGNNDAHLIGRLPISLNGAGVFEHKRSGNVIYACAQDTDVEGASVARLHSLRAAAIKGIGNSPQNSHFQHHLTIGQTEDAASSQHKSLVSKVELLPPMRWEISHLHILVRCRMEGTFRMKVWGSISIENGKVDQFASLRDFDDAFQSEEARKAVVGTTVRSKESVLFSTPTFTYDKISRYWIPNPKVWEPKPHAKDMPENIAVASYNVLAEFEHPPSLKRVPLTLDNLFSGKSMSDILVLQEVTDEFLSLFLNDIRVQKRYPFVSHGPPSQQEVNPLPNYVNMVVFSRFPFSWTWVPLNRKYKGSIIALFSTLGKFLDDESACASFTPLVLATAHLTCGLTDASVLSKRTEIRALLSYMEENFKPNPWVIAGDFNISTSSYTINNLVNNRTIEAKTAAMLSGLDTMLAESCLSDTWMVAHLERAHVAESDEENVMYHGEQGATFDPLHNPLARKTVGQGFNCRPQRYDRILIRSEGFLNVIGFSRFGFISEEQENNMPLHASDHWGVRCGLHLSPFPQSERIQQIVNISPVTLRPVSKKLENTDILVKVLDEHRVIPSDEDVAVRHHAIDLLRTILIEDKKEIESANIRLGKSEVLVPVGSHGLGVWTPSSDVDIMVIGHISSKTFMSIASQKLRKAAVENQDVKILRKVHARTGTMLEISVLGIKMDLQYCAAPAVANSWPQCLRLPPQDSLFFLPPQALLKLKAARDLWFIKGSVPDLKVFRLAYRTIREWAKCRGVYAARFGYLGGIHISVLLARVQKMLVAASPGFSISVGDLVVSFFFHYANFDWKHDIAFDPFFHRQLRYSRSSLREPMSILGWYPPQLNTAHSASLSSVRTIVKELERASFMLETEGMTWKRFLGTSKDAAGDFLITYKSYVKIEVQYWGLSLAKGSSLVGWLESRCVSLLVDMNVRLPYIHARIWPGRFVPSSTSSKGNSVGANTDANIPDIDEDKREEREYRGLYLIGLDRWDGTTKSEDDEKTHITLLAILRRFLEHIHGSEQYFDPNWAWVSADVVRGGNKLTAMELEPDEREWGTYLPPTDEFDDSDEEEIEDTSHEEDEMEATAFLAANREKPYMRGLAVGVSSQGGRFRTSSDVINRLRWDPNLDSNDYLIGYEDRFLGVMERSLDLWKGDQTDDEFIPQHRIIYFKRKSDGEIVWDRRVRKDVIFGSK